MSHRGPMPGHLPIPNAPGGQLTEAWSPRRIAVVRALNLGDLLHSVPALRTLRHRFQEAEITLIGLPWAEDFVRRFSHYIDRFLEFPGYPGIVEAEYDVRCAAVFLKEQQEYGYDLAIQMHGSGYTSNGFTQRLGAAVSAGFYDPRKPEVLDVSGLYPDWLPEIERNLQLVRLLGCGSGDRRLEYPILPVDEHEADRLLDETGPRPLIGIHAGSRAPSRRWPLERFAQLADEIASQSGGTVLLTGGPGEVDQACRVMSRMSRHAVNLAGRTSLGGLGALISSLDLFVSNDTGPAHVARAVGTPSVTVFGPADPERWAPLNQTRHRIVRQAVHCSPCAHWECPIDHRCLQWISVSRVLAEARDLLRQRRPVCID